MTESGFRVLSAIRDGEAKTIPEIAALARVCERKTRSALVGCIMSGLVDEEISDARRYRITGLGLRALSESS